MSNNPPAPGIFHKYNRRAVMFSAVFVVGAILYGYDGTYFTGILEMNTFKQDFGTPTTTDGVTTKIIKSGDQSLYASIVQVGEVFGSLSAGLIGDKFGRKGAMFVALGLVTLGAILQLIVTGSKPLLVVGRLVLGGGVGIVSNCVTLYLSEITPAAIRGTMVSSWQLFLGLGQVVGAGVAQGTKGYSSTFSYRFPIALNIAICLIIFCGMFFVPESPRWYIAKGRLEEAEHALNRVNKQNPDYDLHRELKVMLDAKAAETAESGGESRWSDLLKGAQRKKLLGAFGILVCQQINGVQFVFSYGTNFFTLIGVGNPFLITIVTDIVEVVGVIASFFIVNRYGRRPLLTYTAIMMAVLMLTMGILGSIPNPSHAINSAIAAMIIIFVFVFNCAWGGLAWVVATELASGKNRTKIMSVATAAFWIAAWAVTFTLPYLANEQGGAGLGAKVGYIYGGGAIIGALFVYFYIPETLGRSLEEINIMLELKVPTRAWPEYRTTIDGVHNEQWKAEAKNGAGGQRFVEHADAEKGDARRDSDEIMVPSRF